MDAALTLYVPIHSTAAGEPDPEDLRVVLEVLDDRDLGRLLEGEGARDLHCQVDRTMAGVEAGFVEGLEEKSPGFDAARARLSTVGLQEPTPEKASRLLWYRVIAIVLAAAIPVVSRHIPRGH